MNTGVVTFVSRSEEEIPLSLAALSTGAGVPDGAIVSMVTVVVVESWPVFAA